MKEFFFWVWGLVWGDLEVSGEERAHANEGIPRTEGSASNC